jgi:hypothetical protein
LQVAKNREAIEASRFDSDWAVVARASVGEAFRPILVVMTIVTIVADALLEADFVAMLPKAFLDDLTAVAIVAPSVVVVATFAGRSCERHADSQNAGDQNTREKSCHCIFSKLKLGRQQRRLQGL